LIGCADAFAAWPTSRKAEIALFTCHRTAQMDEGADALHDSFDIDLSFTAFSYSHYLILNIASIKVLLT
jgi:hypothetical protein